jgi:hypothetical protein
MKFSASTTWNLLALNSAKQIQWKVYARKTTALSNSIIGYSGWLDISNRVTAIPSIKSAIEYELGQYKSDSISITAQGITWLDANLFNTAITDYIEIKIECKLGNRGTYASDIAYMFFGFVDFDKGTGKPVVAYDEQADSATFEVFTPDDIGSRIAGEYLSTQFIELDTLANGTNVQGVILQNINACFVTDVNIASYGVKVGVHTITYTYDSAGATTRTICFDDGAPTTITTDDTYYTLSDKDVRQKVKVYVRKKVQMSKTENVVEKIIVKALGSTLPYQFYQKVGGYRLLEIIYGKIGITSLSFDTFQMNTYNGRSIVSYIDLPPADEFVNGSRIAITSDGTYLYTSVGVNIYKRDMATNAYILLTSVTTAHHVYKLMYNSRNNHLWILFSSNGTDFKLRKLLLTNNTYSDITLNVDGSPDACELIDYNYTGSSWKYGIVYAVNTYNANGGALRFVDGTLTDTVIASSAYLSPIVSSLMFIKNGNDVRYGIYPSGSEIYYFSYTINSSGTWVDGGSICPSDGATIGVYNPYEDLVYYLKAGDVCYQFGDIHSPTTLKALSNVKCIYYNPNELKCYCIGFDSAKGYEALFALEGGTIYELDTAQRNPPTIKSLSYSTQTITDIGGIIYGLDSSGRLFQYNSTVNFYIDNADFERKTLTDALHQTLTAFNLIPSISFTKKVYVYRRADGSGNLKSTGNTLSIIKNRVSILNKNSQKYAKCSLIRVTGASESETYDGSTWGALILTDSKTVEISNALIPDKIVRDVAYYAWQFFKTSRDLYLIELGIVPLFQYEPLDAAQLTLTTTKIVKSGYGVIYSMECSFDGTVKIEVLI